MFWKKKPAEKPCKDGMELLAVRISRLEADYASLDRFQNGIDAEMSECWDKVNNALARLGGRTRKAKELEAQPAPPVDLNAAIRAGKVRVPSWGSSARSVGSQAE